MTDESPAEVAAEPLPETPPAKSEDELTVAELAQAVLSREVRPRTASVRRLAQAVVDLTEGSPKKKKGKSGKKDGKKRKLARIPQQKGKKG